MYMLQIYYKHVATKTSLQTCGVFIFDFRFKKQTSKVIPNFVLIMIKNKDATSGYIACGWN